MIEDDTIKLLRECDAGIKMGVSSIGDVLGYVRETDLKSKLETCRAGHERLGKEIQKMLGEYQDEGKEPNVMAKGMSWMKTNAKLVMKESDQTIAELMTDGCNMGVKSLSRYLNQYQAAEKKAKNIAIELINQEDQLVSGIRRYL